MRSEIRSLWSTVPRSLLIQDGSELQVDLDIVEAKIGIPRYPLTPSIDLLLLGIQIEHVSVSDETGFQVPLTNKTSYWIAKSGCGL
jgi:hypothetical protein